MANWLAAAQQATSRAVAQCGLKVLRECAEALADSAGERAENEFLQKLWKPLPQEGSFQRLQHFWIEIDVHTGSSRKDATKHFQKMLWPALCKAVRAWPQDPAANLNAILSEWLSSAMSKMEAQASSSALEMVPPASSPSTCPATEPPQSRPTLLDDLPADCDIGDGFKLAEEFLLSAPGGLSPAAATGFQKLVDECAKGVETGRPTQCAISLGSFLQAPLVSVATHLQRLQREQDLFRIWSSGAGTCFKPPRKRTELQQGVADARLLAKAWLLDMRSYENATSADTSKLVAKTTIAVRQRFVELCTDLG